MQAKGVVRRLEGQYAWVDVSVPQGCGRCHEPGGCGGVNIARPLAAEAQEVRVLNSINAHPGDPVDVLTEEGLPLRAAMLAYGRPVLGLLLGAAAGTALAPQGFADLGAGLGVVFGLLLAIAYGRRHAQDFRADAQVLHLARPGGSCHS
ncbi:MAG: SoxR reducing system RseC family protein [Rhodocyclales bacterium]|nr:SoxR reducing system RseC family protein [Rhodocyclales bacterium]